MYGGFYYGGGNYGGGGESRAVTIVRKAVDRIVMLTKTAWATLTSKRERATMGANINTSVLSATDSKATLTVRDNKTIL